MIGKSALTTARLARAEGKGLEPSTGYPAPDFESSGERENDEGNAHSLGSAAQGAAVDVECSPVDANLQMVIDAWPALPESLRNGILAMVRASGDAK